MGGVVGGGVREVKKKAVARAPVTAPAAAARKVRAGMGKWQLRCVFAISEFISAGRVVQVGVSVKNFDQGNYLT